MVKINRIEIIELPVNNTSVNKFYFGEFPTLKNKIINFINTLHSDNVYYSPKHYTPINPNDELKTSYITLIDLNGIIVLDNYPVKRFVVGEGYGIIHGFYNRINQKINWEKSFILNPGTKYANRAYLFHVFYNENEIFYKKYYKYFCRSIEVVIDSTSKRRFYFPINNNIVDQNIDFIEIMAVSWNSILPSGRSNIQYNAIREATLLITYKEHNREYSMKFPLWGFDAFNQWKKIMFRDIKIDLEKSFIEFATTDYLEFDKAVQLYFFWKKKI